MDSPTASMSLEEALGILNVQADASFDTVLEAKNKLLRPGVESARAREIEAAYDIMLAYSYRRRLSGDVSTAIRFADVSKSKPATAAKPSLPVGLPNLPRLTPPSAPGRGSRSGGSSRSSGSDLMPIVAASTGQQLATQSVVFLALGLWTLLDGFGQVSYGGATVPKVPGFQLALAVAACAYFLSQQKRTSIGKAVGFALGAFVLGGVVGNGLEAWLRVDLVPLGPVSNPATVVAEGSVLATYLVAILLA